MFCSVHSVVHVRETRLTGIISHIMIGLSMLLLPYPLSYIPAPVLDGLFLYVAFTALYGNQMFDRVLLFFTEQVKHYLEFDFFATSRRIYKLATQSHSTLFKNLNLI